MKRFYKHVGIAQGEGGWHLLLDGKPVKTPEGDVIAAPCEAIAKAMQQEWQRQGEKVNWETLPVTRLVGGAQTLSAAEAQQLRNDLAAYVDTDMICYWSDEDAVAAQHAVRWQPVLDWVRARYDVSLRTTTSMRAIEQPAQAHAAVQRYLAELPALGLVVFGRLTPLLGSVWLALALREGAVDVQGAINAAHVDEQLQEQRWGEDTEAAAARAAKANEIRLLTEVVLMLEAGGKVC